jgi:hypothetical protein
LPFASQTGPLTRRFAKVPGSTVFRRLLKNNATDCFILVLISLGAHICG